jgi:hypothetical protein
MPSYMSAETKAKALKRRLKKQKEDSVLLKKVQGQRDARVAEDRKAGFTEEQSRKADNQFQTKLSRFMKKKKK